MSISKPKLIFGIITSVFCFLLLILQSTVSVFEPYSAENTTEFFATVSKVQRSAHGGYALQIQTEEYPYTLYVSSDVRQYLKEADLQSGDAISFRVSNIDLEQLEGPTFVYIVALQTEDTDILALSDYNLYTETWKAQAGSSATVAMMVLLGVSLYCWATLKKKN